MKWESFAKALGPHDTVYFFQRHAGPYMSLVRVSGPEFRERWAMVWGFGQPEMIAFIEGPTLEQQRDFYDQQEREQNR